MTMEKCPKCGSDIKLVPAGVSKRTGRPYNAFQACSNRECDWKPEQKSFTPRPAKTAQMKEVIDYKAGGINKFQDRKEYGMRLSAANRDATILITTFFPELKDPDLIKKTWLKWREWLYNRMAEQPQPDSDPFTKIPYDEDWPPSEME